MGPAETKLLCRLVLGGVADGMSWPDVWQSLRALVFGLAADDGAFITCKLELETLYRGVDSLYRT